MQRVMKMKDILLYIGLVLGGLLLLCLLIWMLVKKRHVLLSVAAGVLGLIGVNLLGVGLGYTVASVGVCVLLGLPGLALLLILRLL
jgi:hypothetical protein